MYVSVADVRAEGITVADASDERIEAIIRLAERYIERVTGRFFEPRPQSLTIDGPSGRVLRLGHPIIRIDVVAVDSSSATTPVPIDPSSYRVYNRHLTQGLLIPDDRDDPRIELVRGGDASVGLDAIWPCGVQNVRVAGVFGYTDPDGSPMGVTPMLIRHTTKLLVLRELPLMADLDGREDAQRRWRLTSERTRDQAYTLGALASQGAFTGDREIDLILAVYTRPADLGAA